MSESSFQDQLIEARRQQIIDAAIAVIAEQGFQRTTIKQIAGRAGVADGTIYNYFKNKDAILFAIVNRLSEAEMRELDFAEAAKMNFADFVTGYVEHRMAEVGAAHDILKVVMSETIVNAELSKTIYDQTYAPGFAVAETYLQQLMTEGNLTEGDPVIMARLFASPVLGLLLLRLLGDQHVIDNWDKYAQATVQFLLNAYGADHES